MIISNFSQFLGNREPISKFDYSDQVVKTIGAKEQGRPAIQPSGLGDMARKPASAKPAIDIKQIVQILSVVRDILAELRDIYRLFKNPPEGQQAST